MIFRFKYKFNENIVEDEKGIFYQLEHFKNKRTFPFKKLTYNQDRKAYRIYSQWVSSKRLNKFKTPINLIKKNVKFDFLTELDNAIKRNEILKEEY